MSSRGSIQLREMRSTEATTTTGEKEEEEDESSLPKGQKKKSNVYTVRVWPHLRPDFKGLSCKLAA